MKKYLTAKGRKFAHWFYASARVRLRVAFFRHQKKSDVGMRVSSPPDEPLARAAACPAAIFWWLSFSVACQKWVEERICMGE